MELPKKASRMHGCGNTFVVMDAAGQARNISDESDVHEADIVRAKEYMLDTGYRPDGFLFVHTSPGLEEYVMKYYDVDRNTGEMMHENMCGNGIRCFARYIFDEYSAQSPLLIMTDDGMKKAHLRGDQIMVEMGPAREYQELTEDGLEKLFFVNTSLAHIVLFRDKLDIHSEEEIAKYTLLGRELRYDQGLMERLGHNEGLHVDFASVNPCGDVSLLTYEVGVEGITLACGTGAAATAYVAHKALGLALPIKVINRGGIMTVDIKDDEIYLTGPAQYQ